jgi:hypothetical protein
VEKYLRRGGPVRTPDPKQRWLTFVQNHAKVIVACDLFVAVTASFRILYVLVILELGTRRIVHHNVTAHPTAEWTVHTANFIIIQNQYLTALLQECVNHVNSTVV